MAAHVKHAQATTRIVADPDTGGQLTVGARFVWERPQCVGGLAAHVFQVSAESYKVDHIAVDGVECLLANKCRH